MQKTPFGLVFILGALVGGAVVLAGFWSGREYVRQRQTVTPAIVDDGAHVTKREHVYSITCAGGGEPVREGVTQ